MPIKDDDPRAAAFDADFAAAMRQDGTPHLTEKQFQAKVVEHAEQQLGLRVFWIPQSARTGIGRQAKTARGWPDLTIGSPRTGRVIHRECKSEVGETSAEQDAWLWILRNHGGNTGIWRPSDWESGKIQAELKALG